MTDKELLELAAKAAGYIDDWCPDGWTDEGPWRWHEEMKWNPLTDDGDALRLAADLCIDIEPGNSKISAWCKPIHDWITEHVDNDRYAAVRRVIVRSAAKIGSEK